MLPWWVGIGLALASYLLLHHVASQAVVAITQPGQLVAMVTQTLWTTFASFWSIRLARHLPGRFRHIGVAAQVEKESRC